MKPKDLSTFSETTTVEPCTEVVQSSPSLHRSLLLKSVSILSFYLRPGLLSVLLDYVFDRNFIFSFHLPWVLQVIIAIIVILTFTVLGGECKLSSSQCSFLSFIVAFKLSLVIHYAWLVSFHPWFEQFYFITICILASN
jgi:hypothetical protein